MSMEVHPITAGQAKPWLQRHYTRRPVGAVHRFGLFDAGELVGVIVYSIPSGVGVCASVCGPLHANKVLVLSRLVVQTPTPNAASFFIGRSLNLLPRPSVVLSYADQNEGHVGYVYQACSATYTGLTGAERFYLLEDETVVKVRRHVDDKRVVDTVPQLPKYRYVFITGSRSQKRRLRKALLYPVLPYPKGQPSSTHGSRSRRCRRVEYIACAHCGGYFPPRRADAKFCSPSCRTLAYYDRHRVLTAKRQGGPSPSP